MLCQKRVVLAVGLLDMVDFSRKTIGILRFLWNVPIWTSEPWKNPDCLGYVRDDILSSAYGDNSHVMIRIPVYQPGFHTMSQGWSWPAGILWAEKNGLLAPRQKQRAIAEEQSFGKFKQDAFESTSPRNKWNQWFFNLKHQSPFSKRMRWFQTSSLVS